jgi:hypothetical protein
MNTAGLYTPTVRFGKEVGRNANRYVLKKERKMGNGSLF